MTIRTVGVLAALCLAVAPLSACGGSDDETASKAISAELVDSGDDTLSVDQEQADCMGDGLVDKIGVDKLQEYGILNDDLGADENVDEVTMSEDDANSAADVVMDCTDFRDMMMGQMDTAGMDEDTKACFDEALTDDVLHDFLAGLFAGSTTDSQQQLTEAMTACMVDATS